MRSFITRADRKSQVGQCLGFQLIHRHRHSPRGQKISYTKIQTLPNLRLPISSVYYLKALPALCDPRLCAKVGVEGVLEIREQLVVLAAAPFGAVVLLVAAVLVPVVGNADGGRVFSLVDSDITRFSADSAAHHEHPAAAWKVNVSKYVSIAPSTEFLLLTESDN